jgi:S-adenosylmethionine:tRNA ribosyltransferase-isomerase
VSAPAFTLPRGLEAHDPPEARGLARDDVRLLVATRADGGIAHARFGDLPELLGPGDLLVVNTSATVPAAIPAQRADGSLAQLRFSTAAPDHEGADWWIVELRTADGTAPLRARAGERLALAGAAAIEIAAPFLGGDRLWIGRLVSRLALGELLDRHGQPIRYDYVPDAWPLEAYQTVFARDPGSAEMPSAARPFTSELVTRLVTAGVHLAPVTLHCGVSSPERHEPPAPEWYAVPEATARLVNAVRWWGGRVIAVGTTAVRALESAAAPDGSVGESTGWTSLVIDAARGLRVVDGLITGWHEPEASHLALLEAVAGEALLTASYDAALREGYLWHEFGDSHLILP